MDTAALLNQDWQLSCQSWLHECERQPGCWSACGQGARSTSWFVCCRTPLSQRFHEKQTPRQACCPALPDSTHSATAVREVQAESCPPIGPRENTMEMPSLCGGQNCAATARLLPQSREARNPGIHTHPAARFRLAATPTSQFRPAGSMWSEFPRKGFLRGPRRSIAFVLRNGHKHDLFVVASLFYPSLRLIVWLRCCRRLAFSQGIGPELEAQQSKTAAKLVRGQTTIQRADLNASFLGGLSA